MTALDAKLLRDLRRIWAQSLAMALVLACGVMVQVMATGTQRSLTETRDTFYERNRFADVFARALHRVPSLPVSDLCAGQPVVRAVGGTGHGHRHSGCPAGGLGIGSADPGGSDVAADPGAVSPRLGQRPGPRVAAAANRFRSDMRRTFR